MASASRQVSRSNKGRVDRFLPAGAPLLMAMSFYFAIVTA
jgi:hypothetical protein